MTSRNAFDAFAVARGEGLHPELRELLDRAAARPFSELTVRGDGMLQAGPSPASEALGAPSNATKCVALETGTPLAIRSIRGRAAQQ
ncbi:hypothetical protein [Bradyrhizobium genosp. P]|uniref:hypothetical protein n=1 Tax=Bradyrhizobium genosp. P TaxID=83641 RepID=UPI003CF14EB4